MNTLVIDGEQIPVRADETHEYVLETKLVALGYGVSPTVIRRHKQEHEDELVEGKHWVVQKMNTLGGSQSSIYWTKRGIVRLGFFIKSARAKKFRDMAEDLVVGTSESSRTLPMTYPDAMRALAIAHEKGEPLARALAAIYPRVQFGSVSKATGQPRTKLIPAHFRSGFNGLNEMTQGFIGIQIDLPFFQSGRDQEALS